MGQSKISMGASQMLPVHGPYERMVLLAQGRVRIRELVLQRLFFGSVVVAALRVHVEQRLSKMHGRESNISRGHQSSRSMGASQILVQVRFKY